MMAHSHYVMDLYYALDRPEQYRRDVLRVDAADDAAALAEAKRIDQWRNTAFYHLRAIRNSARSGDRLIYDSRSEDAPAGEIAITPAPLAAP